MSANPSIEELTERSQLVFEGTIRELSAATWAAVPVNELTAVVSVDEVLSGPESLSELRGAAITLQLAEPADVGLRAVFFARSWLQGESLAVVEVGRRALDDEAPRVGRELSEAFGRAADAELRQRIDSAELIVSGTTSEVGTAPSGVRSVDRSEHDPDYREGLIEVATVEKGEPGGSTVAVVCAQSRDVTWYGAPKLEVGQTGVWLLHRRAIGQPPVERLTALDPLDLQPLDQLERIRRLLSESGSEPR